MKILLALFFIGILILFVRKIYRGEQYYGATRYRRCKNCGGPYIPDQMTVDDECAPCTARRVIIKLHLRRD